MVQWIRGQRSLQKTWWIAAIFTFVLACNIDDGGALRSDDVGDLDVGQPDSGQPDADAQPASSCDDGEQNGQESGVDCGGPACATCELGESCGTSSDCASGFCTAGVCVDESCADVACAADETCYRSVCYLACEDSDGCDPSSRCYQGSCVPLDCSTTECSEGETCYRGVCYGACSGDEGCSEEGAECVEGSCVVSTCDDGLQNGDETDIDCGGSECEACAPGKMCELGEDCQEPLATPWSDCDFGEGTCAEVGTQTRTVTTSSCGDAMTCEVSEEVQTQECTRQTDDQTCGETVTGEWGACQGAGEQGVCTTEGQRRRVITSYVCADGGCEVVEEEEFEACVLDTNAQACGAPEAGAWSACGGFDSVCDQDGTRSRTVTYFECDGGDCNERVDTETETCLRATTGASCGEETYSPWSACEGFSGVCGQTGTQSRTVTYRECAGGVCSTRTATESQTCTRSTNGTQCQADATGNWSSCTYANSCSDSGSRTRTVTEYACQGGSCAQTSRTETDTAGCARHTNGISCGGVTNGSWSNCGYASQCSTSGSRTRTVTYQECASGSCSTRSVVETDTASCTRSTAGNSCEGGVTETPWTTCSGFADVCDTTGTRSRQVTTRTCSGGTCQSNTLTENGSCTRTVAPGTTCGAGTTWDSWSSCNIASGQCSGTQTRTRTDRTCSGGNCQSTNTTETQSCNRSNGTTCGSGITHSNWSSCSIASGQCSGTQTRTRTERTCSNGTCTSANFTETQSCNQSNGTTCGSGTTWNNWSSCNVASNQCTGTRTRTRTERTCSSGTCASNNFTESQNCNASNGTTCGATTYGNWSSCSIVPICEFSIKSRSVTRRTCSGGSCQTNTSTEWEDCYYNAPNPGQDCP
ncbi:hypothetical protein EA187_06760 [Lujinxingia sediminis]|uniref:SRCR domain-containing protein n=1 Tax=Lujinxingia sediminis TaxID=2480984 RepID=A0ABY0CVH7_9DELT|nr:hypothetical protein [Lujinxingia sediminis]RVU46829.1 hypothetical protein EA187_06760 [Lujinxingia sediminis]